ncbi:protein of unknown function [Cupriavidus taiwanensis]|uniref:Uncharacterized protein n=1 Tax=Cupriavidus taiwanensis TaxID=164546 RepID=A0A9Q7UUI9_9BURK|nr:protein of unknown function [Cupriavidus taiwanensis]
MGSSCFFQTTVRSSTQREACLTTSPHSSNHPDQLSYSVIWSPYDLRGLHFGLQPTHRQSLSVATRNCFYLPPTERHSSPEKTHGFWLLPQCAAIF